MSSKSKWSLRENITEVQDQYDPLSGSKIPQTRYFYGYFIHCRTDQMMGVACAIWARGYTTRVEILRMSLN